MELTKANVQSLSQPLYQVWNAIGYDMYDVFDDPECDEELTPEVIIECCIDANRLTTFVDGEEGKAAEALVTQLIKEHGYDEVLKFLAKTFPMC